MDFDAAPVVDVREKQEQKAKTPDHAFGMELVAILVDKKPKEGLNDILQDELYLSIWNKYNEEVHTDEERDAFLEKLKPKTFEELRELYPSVHSPKKETGDHSFELELASILVDKKPKEGLGGAMQDALYNVIWKKYQEEKGSQNKDEFLEQLKPKTFEELKTLYPF